ncbi:MAG: ABA4-like family protein [Ktedonobacteraceae bacterium]
MSILFSVSSILVLPFWILMIVAPHWRWTKRIMQSPFVIIAPAFLYILLVLPHIGEVFPAVVNPTLSGIATLLSTPTGTTIAWVHFLAFDLFVGRWVYLESRERGINAWLMAPILFLTLMLGPLGFLLFLLVRAIPGLTSKKSSPSVNTQANLQ